MRGKSGVVPAVTGDLLWRRLRGENPLLHFGGHVAGRMYLKLQHFDNVALGGRLEAFDIGMINNDLFVSAVTGDYDWRAQPDRGFRPWRCETSSSGSGDGLMWRLRSLTGSGWGK